MDYTTPIRDGLVSITGFLDELQPVAVLSWEEYAADRVSQHAAERLVELLIDSCSGIARMCLRRAGKALSKSNADSLLALADMQVIPREMGLVLADFARFRVVLGSDYRGAHDRRAYDIVQQGQVLFPQFIAAVAKLLPGTPSEGEL